MSNRKLQISFKTVLVVIVCFSAGLVVRDWIERLFPSHDVRREWLLQSFDSFEDYRNLSKDEVLAILGPPDEIVVQKGMADHYKWTIQTGSGTQTRLSIMFDGQDGPLVAGGFFRDDPVLR